MGLQGWRSAPLGSHYFSARQLPVSPTFPRRQRRRLRGLRPLLLLPLLLLLGLDVFLVDCSAFSLVLSLTTVCRPPAGPVALNHPASTTTTTATTIGTKSNSTAAATILRLRLLLLLLVLLPLQRFAPRRQVQAERALLTTCGTPHYWPPWPQKIPVVERVARFGVSGSGFPTVFFGFRALGCMVFGSSTVFLGFRALGCMVFGSGVLGEAGCGYYLYNVRK